MLKKLKLKFNPEKISDAQQLVQFKKLRLEELFFDVNMQKCFLKLSNIQVGSRGNGNQCYEAVWNEKNLLNINFTFIKPYALLYR